MYVFYENVIYIYWLWTYRPETRLSRRRQTPGTRSFPVCWCIHCCQYQPLEISPTVQQGRIIALCLENYFYSSLLVDGDDQRICVLCSHHAHFGLIILSFYFFPLTLSKKLDTIHYPKLIIIKILKTLKVLEKFMD